MARHEILREKEVTIHIARGGPRQVFFAVDNSETQSSPTRAATVAYACIADWLDRHEMQLAHERVFGSLSAQSAVAAAREQAMSEAAIDPRPCFSYIQGHPVFGEGLAGMLIHAVKPDEGSSVSARIEEDGMAARIWRMNGARYFQLHGVHGLSDQDRAAQAGGMFANANEFLRREGAAYRDVIRTWIYLSRILEWYGDLNRARDAKYAGFQLMPDLAATRDVRDLRLPASTGIEGDNRFGTACAMDALAITGPRRPAIHQMANKVQKEAFRYGSAFSRGACIRDPQATRIEISGTASIDESGHSTHIGDLRAQIGHTLDAVQALLATEEAGLTNISGATVFLKHAEDRAVYRAVTRERGLNDLPAVLVQADVCRGDLLFEIDGTAILP